MSETNAEVARREFLKKLVAGGASVVVLGGGAAVGASLPAGVAASAAPAPSEGPVHDYAFVVDVAKCIGCGKCVEACKRENNVPDGYTRTWIERYVATNEGLYIDSPDAAINGFPEDVDDALRERARWAAFVPKLCNHCREAPCVQVCPVGATFRSDEGFVLVDPEHCIACGYCVQGCPYGVRFINPQHHIADKCTWCYHRVVKDLLPACVTVCPTGSRRFGDLNDPASFVTQVHEEDKYHVLKPGMHTDSVCFYLNLPREVI